MNMAFMFLLFMLACVVIFIFLTKKQMFIARAVFLAFGIVIGISSAMLIIVQQAVGETPVYLQSETIGIIVTYMLCLGTAFFGAAIAVVVIATILLSIFAVKKIVEYLKRRCPKIFRTAKVKYILPKKADLPQRKIFVLYCRWNN